jgi:formylmethanofuran dehydrogenase subunit A
MSRLKISGGHVVDPANGVDGIADIWIEAGRVISSPEDPSIKADRTIDARGDVVMPAGVDVHCHIAGPKVNGARAMRPEEVRRGGYLHRDVVGRSGTLGSVPSTFSTGAKYAGLGYGTAVDAAIAPLMARHTHHELADTPIIDKAFLILLGNNHYVMERIRDGDREGLRAFVAWAVGACKAFGVKVVNPGGVEAWKQGKGSLGTLDDVVPGFDVTPRAILTGLARAVDELGLPHPMHLHGLHLGLPGNAAITRETMEAIDGHRAHFAHIQFHSYGGDPGDLGKLSSQVGMLADYINAHANLSVDVGQVMFGETTSMTADAGVGEFLQRVTGRKWLSHDVELETGCGVVPIKYEDKNVVHATQWAIGLEWFLCVDDPWRIALSTDHPNGGSFLAYPQIMALLMDRGLRADTLAALPAKVKDRCPLGDLPREYSLSEIAIITRAGPARILGLKSKGHLGPGADADVTIYRPDADKTRMFSMPRYLIKGGEIVLDDGEIRQSVDGSLLHVAPERDPDAELGIAGWFNERSSIRFANYAVSEEEVSLPRRVGGES